MDNTGTKAFEYSRRSTAKSNYQYSHKKRYISSWLFKLSDWLIIERIIMTASIWKPTLTILAIFLTETIFDHFTISDLLISDAPSSKQLSRKEQSVDDSAYNQKLLNSIVKGASDFKCKHCQEPFGKLDDLTRHMYQKEWFNDS